MITREEGKKFIGKHVNIEWTYPYPGGMSGIVKEITDDEYLNLDYGYGIQLNEITKIEEEPEPITQTDIEM